MNIIGTQSTILYNRGHHTMKLSMGAFSRVIGNNIPHVWEGVLFILGFEKDIDSMGRTITLLVYEGSNQFYSIFSD